MSKWKEKIKINKFKFLEIVLLLIIILYSAKMLLLFQQMQKDQMYLKQRITLMEKNNPSINTGFFHLSIDDTITLFEDINKKQDFYKSIFENKTLQHFKQLHEQYGLVVTFYCYYENENFNLSQMTHKFKREFEENSNWLKFGFHGFNEQSYEVATYEKTLKEYEQMMKQLKNIVGEKSIDYVVRLNNFKGSVESIKALLESEYPIQGLLGSDDGRVSYDLTVEEQRELDTKEYVKKGENREIPYVKTDLRLENLKNEQILQENIQKQNGFKKGETIGIVFTHEWLLKDQMFHKIELMCQMAKANGYVFDFVENHLKG